MCGAIDGEVETENVIGLKSRIGGAHVDEAAHQQTGGDEQHDRAGDFGAHEKIAQPRVRRGPTLEARGNVRRRCDRNGECSGDGEGNCEQQDRQVNRDLFNAREPGWEQWNQQLEEGIGAKDAKGRASDGERNRLHKGLPHEPRASGAECGADGKFGLPSGSTREQQVGEIHAANQEEHADRGEQQPYCRTHRFGDVAKERLDVDARDRGSSWDIRARDWRRSRSFAHAPARW